MKEGLKACILSIYIMLIGSALITTKSASAQTCNTVAECANLAVQAAQAAAKAAANAVPVHTIIAWYQNSGPIPDGWALCDGNNGTPDLMGRYIQGGKPGEITGAPFGTATLQLPVTVTGETNKPDQGKVYHVTDGGPPQTRGLDSQSPATLRGSTDSIPYSPPSVKIIFLMKVR